MLKHAHGQSCATKGLLECATGEGDEAALELAFSKKKADDRKQWLASFVPGTFLDQSVDQISYSDFVNKARARPRRTHAAQLCSPPADWLRRL